MGGQKPCHNVGEKKGTVASCQRGGVSFTFCTCLSSLELLFIQEMVSTAQGGGVILLRLSSMLRHTTHRCFYFLITPVVLFNPTTDLKCGCQGVLFGGGL